MTFQYALDQFYDFLRKKPVYHGIFWALFYFLLVMNDLGDLPLPFVMRNELINLMFYMAAVYINVRILIPKYLAKHAFYYLLSIIILSLLITPIKVFALYLTFSDSEYLRSILVKNQIFLYIGTLFVILCSTVLKVLTDWWRYQQEKQQLITQSMQSELRFLRSQVNPHFLFNTLNNLYALTLTKNEKAPDVVLKLAEIMRYMLYDCNERQVPLAREVSFVENYIALELLRLTKGTDVSFEVTGEVKDQMIAPLLFVPFLENSFKHGLNRHLNAEGFVHIRLNIMDNHLSFFIENSKPTNLPENMKPHSGGIGLENIKSRLRLLYPFRHKLLTHANDQVYTVQLELDLKGLQRG